jgi:hypothetical protein
MFSLRNTMLVSEEVPDPAQILYLSGTVHKPYGYGYHRPLTVPIDDWE